MRERASKRWPLAVAIALYLALVAGLLTVALGANGGTFTFPLDDPYIHLAIARNALVHHVWGVTPYEFSSSTSAPLWTALLALFGAVVGVSPALAVALNLAAALGALVLGERFLARLGAPTRVRAITLCAAVLATPMPALTVAGMEHLLHALVALAFLDRVCAASVREPAAGPPSGWHLPALAAVLAMTRYEGVFEVAAGALVLWIARRRVLACATFAAALAPVLGYGLWSVRHGWFVLPTSVLIKGHVPRPTWTGAGELLAGALDRLRGAPHVLALALLLALLLVTSVRATSAAARTLAVALAVATLTVALHVLFASIGWFHRYEAYFLFVGILLCGAALPGCAARWRHGVLARVSAPALALLAAALVGATMAPRAWTSLRDTPLACHDRYDEHLPMARFVQRYYDHDVVALNDIGAVAWYSHARLLDLYGLGSREPYAYGRSGSGYGAREVREWTRRARARIAVVQPGWPEIRQRIPADWTPVGAWALPRNVVFGDTLVAFYAVDPAAAAELRDRLRRFERELPAEVRPRPLEGGPGGP